MSAGTERLAAHHARISTFRLGRNKHPLGPWADRMTDLPDESDVVAEAAITQGYAMVCGDTEARLIVFDFEGAFGTERWKELLRRLEGAGLADNFTTWCQGYTVRTPGGGLHVAVHVIGDSELPGNTKLAMVDGKVIAETRGRGGYVVGPGSNKDTHPTGGTWTWYEGSFEAIAWDTIEVIVAIAKIIASFGDPEPAPPTPALRLVPEERPQLPNLRSRAEGLMPSMAEIIEPHGFIHHHDDAHGQLWTRPGKNPREGHSVRINHNGRLMVFSSAVSGLPASDSRTYDEAEVALALELGRLPTPSECAEWFFRYIPRPDHPGGRAVDGRAETAPADSSLYLPESFWQSREWTIALRDVSLARGLSPDAVLGAFLSGYATTVPMNIWVPAVVGARAPLNLFSVIVGPSGSGKTAAMTVAADLLGPVANPDVRLGNSLRSGEGLITLVLKPQKKRRGEEEQFEPSFNAGVQVHFDEGGTLGKQTERAGSTTIPYLNTAWAGAGVVGGAKAADLQGFPANAVRICAVMGVQYGAAANLFTGESERLGFPQRLLYFGNDNPILESLDVDTMDSSPIKPLDLPIYQHSDFSRFPQEMAIPANIAREVRLWTQYKTVHGVDNPLDGHKMNLRLRVASLFALMDGEGRFGLSDEDWDLALCVERTSRAIRGRLVQSLGNVPIEQARQRGRLDAVRLEAQHDVWMEKRATRIRSRLELLSEGLAKKELRQLLRSDERKQLPAILEYAMARGWVIHRDDRYFAQ